LTIPCHVTWADKVYSVHITSLIAVAVSMASTGLTASCDNHKGTVPPGLSALSKEINPFCHSFRSAQDRAYLVYGNAVACYAESSDRSYTWCNIALENMASQCSNKNSWGSYSYSLDGRTEKYECTGYSAVVWNGKGCQANPEWCI
jgi:hypothetical protein